MFRKQGPKKPESESRQKASNEPTSERLERLFDPSKKKVVLVDFFGSLQAEAAEICKTIPDGPEKEAFEKRYVVGLQDLTREYGVIKKSWTEMLGFLGTLAFTYSAPKAVLTKSFEDFLKTIDPGETKKEKEAIEAALDSRLDTDTIIMARLEEHLVLNASDEELEAFKKNKKGYKIANETIIRGLLIDEEFLHKKAELFIQNNKEVIETFKDKMPPVLKGFFLIHGVHLALVGKGTIPPISTDPEKAFFKIYVAYLIKLKDSVKPKDGVKPKDNFPKLDEPIDKIPKFLVSTSAYNQIGFVVDAINLRISTYNREKRIEARLKVEQEAKERAEREVKEKAEREVKEKAERQAKERVEQEAKKRVEREVKEKAEKSAQVSISQPGAEAVVEPSPSTNIPVSLAVEEAKAKEEAKVKEEAQKKAAAALKNIREWRLAAEAAELAKCVSVEKEIRMVETEQLAFSKKKRQLILRYKLDEDFERQRDPQRLPNDSQENFRKLRDVLAGKEAIGLGALKAMHKRLLDYKGLREQQWEDSVLFEFLRARQNHDFTDANACKLYLESGILESVLKLVEYYEQKVAQNTGEEQELYKQKQLKVNQKIQAEIDEMRAQSNLAIKKINPSDAATVKEQLENVRVLLENAPVLFWFKENLTEDGMLARYQDKNSQKSIMAAIQERARGKDIKFLQSKIEKIMKDDTLTILERLTEVNATIDLMSARMKMKQSKFYNINIGRESFDKMLSQLKTDIAAATQALRAPTQPVQQRAEGVQKEFKTIEKEKKVSQEGPQEAPLGTHITPQHDSLEPKASQQLPLPKHAGDKRPPPDPLKPNS